MTGRAKLERETGFEPATSTLARSHSTTELFPLGPTAATAEPRSYRNHPGEVKPACGKAFGSPHRPTSTRTSTYSGGGTGSRSTTVIPFTRSGGGNVKRHASSAVPR